MNRLVIDTSLVIHTFPPPPLNSAVVQADSRMSLFLNNGSQSNPTVVVLLSPEMLDEQLNRACQAFVDHTVKVRRVLHKYDGSNPDFGGQNGSRVIHGGGVVPASPSFFPLFGSTPTLEPGLRRHNGTTELHGVECFVFLGGRFA